ncbi:MAG: hypothetical protein JWM31_1353 [Solirubrobacterales bacterium]|nr:hypothetical protein [Solirubrobacterales bacterium]
MTRHETPAETHLADARFHLRLAQRSLNAALEQARDKHTHRVAGRAKQHADAAIKQAREGVRHTERSAK